MSFDYLKTFPQYLLPKKALTLLAGLFANNKNPKIKNFLIESFIKKYKVNMAEAILLAKDYDCFNDFFIRQLKSDVRPIAEGDVVSPVDGVVSEIGAINENLILQAKGRYYSLAQLLAVDESMIRPFINGHFATLYLSPKDYHRIHMPIDASLKEMVYVPGKLFSVQPTTARVVPNLFARNERLVCLFDTKLGPMAMVLVGATIVGAINTRWQGDIKRSKQKQYFDFSNLDSAFIAQGEEMGHFKLGSTVILLFGAEAKIEWLANLKSGSPIKYGELIAKQI
ncbi:MAG: archaetidylserine decarboxylase [Proteobacteria bacterium]|nr:archaetidylserine decarboxylase [Pseudomonadota bacterium]